MQNRITELRDEEIKGFLKSIIPSLDSVKDIVRVESDEEPYMDSIECTVITACPTAVDEDFPDGIAHPEDALYLDGNGEVVSDAVGGSRIADYAWRAFMLERNMLPEDLPIITLSGREVKLLYDIFDAAHELISDVNSAIAFDIDPRQVRDLEEPLRYLQDLLGEFECRGDVEELSLARMFDNADKSLGV